MVNSTKVAFGSESVKGYLCCIQISFIILLCSICILAPCICLVSNKKGPNSFSAVFMKLNLPNDDLK